jgi:transient receptor potential cation channel subfamily V protein 5
MQYFVVKWDLPKLYCRMLKWFPKLLNDIYLSEEYYGENVLHMCCVAEDASLVKWLLDIGADIHRCETSG